MGEFAPTFAPGNLAGAAGCRFGRQAVPRGIGPGQAGQARQKQVHHPDRRHHHGRLGEDELATFTRWGDHLHWDPARGTGVARTYEIRIYGEREHWSVPRPPRIFADGLNRPHGSVGDAKFRDSSG